MKNKTKTVLGGLLSLIALTGCNNNTITNEINTKNEIRNNETVTFEYKKVNNDDISDYLSDDCKTIFNDGGETYNSYKMLSKIGLTPNLTDVNGNTVNLNGKVLLYVVNNANCDATTGEDEGFFKEIINDYGYRIIQVFTSQEQQDTYYERLNLKKQELDNFQTTIIDEEELSQLAVDMNEEIYFIQDGKVLLNRNTELSTLDTFDYIVNNLLEKVNSCTTLKQSLENYDKENLKEETSESSILDEEYYAKKNYNNPSLKTIFEVSLNEDVVIGLNIKNLNMEDISSNTDTFNSGIRDALGTLSDTSLSFGIKPDGNVLYEDDNSNIYLIFKLSKKNTTGYLEEADGAISEIFVNVGDKPYKIVLNPWIELKLKS